MKEAVVTIKTTRGLHATPACMFAQMAMVYKSDIKLIDTKNDKIVNGKSIIGVMSLGIKSGDEVKIVTYGEDEQEMINALVDLVERRNFDGE